MVVPTFGEICRRVAKSNIDNVYYIPELLSYEQVKDLLVHVKYPEQLAEIEAAAPHIVEGSDELWEPMVWKQHGTRHKRFVKEYKAEQKKKHGTDEEPKIDSWRDLYFQYNEQDKIDEAEGIATLMTSHQKHLQAKDDHRARIISQRAVNQIRGPGRLSGSSFSRAFAPRPKTIVQKARLQAKEEKKWRQMASVWAKPTQTQVPSRGKVKIAPKGFKEEVRISKQPKFIPRTSKPQPSPEDEERARREARLLAAKNGTASKGGKSGDSPDKAEASTKPATAPSTTPKKPAIPVVRTTTDLLFPSGSIARQQQKVIIKTVPAPGSGPTPSKVADGLKASSATLRASLSTSASPSGQACSSASPDRQHARPQAGFPAKLPQAPSPAAPAKRPVAPMDATTAASSSPASSPPGSGPGSPPGAPPPRKKKKVADVFVRPKRRT